MPKLGEIIGAGGILPAVASGKFGDENRGFAAGIIPGLLYQEKMKNDQEEENRENVPVTSPAAYPNMKRGGKVKKMAKGGSVKSSASKRGDGCAQRGKTKGRMV